MTIDPITLAVVHNGLRQVATEMDLAFERSAFSPVIAESRDRASGVYHRESGEVIVQGDTGLPIFIGVMQFTTQAVLKALGVLEPDDVAIVSDPYSGGTHVMDVRMVAPVYFKGQLFAYVANTGHWVDMGGSVPGGFGTSVTEVQQEGLRLPPVKLYRRGVMSEDLVQVILANIRIPELQLGDLHAQVAGLRVGQRRLVTLLDQYGTELVDACVREMRDRSERLIRSHLATIPSDVYSFETELDNDGIVDKPLSVRLDLTVAEDCATFDFSRSSPPCRGPLNSVISTTTSAVYVALKHVFPDVPINAGFFEPLTVIAPPTTFLHATYPRPVSGCAAEVAQRIVDAVFGALSRSSFSRVVGAPFGTVANISIGNDDPDTGRPFVMYWFSGGGYGGHPDGDGLSNAASSIGISKTQPLEILEQRFPVHFDYYRLRDDSGGPGQHRGGLGIEYGLTLLRGAAKGSALMDRGFRGPFGIKGGLDGAQTFLEFQLGGHACQLPLRTKGDGILIAAGDTVRVRTPGGGGYGDPLTRVPERVRDDVVQGYVSLDSAQRHYGVALHPSTLAIDVAETKRLRADTTGRGALT
jgi:N-methylhydantoinase B